MKRIMNYKGYTLVELVIVMGIFIIIMIISTYAFENILKRSGQMGKSAESDISGMMGLEMMRADIAAAGFGLPWAFQALPNSYNEIIDDGLPATDVLSTTAFNGLRDLPTDPKAGPRAIACATGSSASNSGIDYLVVKGTALGMNPSSRKWNFVNYSTNSTSGANLSYLLPRGDATSELGDGDRVITIISTYTTTNSGTKQLMVTNKAFQYKVLPKVPPVPGPAADSNFRPFDKTQMLVAYGVSNTDLLMPYNRVDFYVDKAAYVNKPATKPAACCPGTGALTKAVADQQGGWGNVTYPLLDCVGDMKIRFDLDQLGDGTNVTLTDAATVGAMTADNIRTQIRNVRVYILAHEGKKDPSFTYPMNDTSNVICVGPHKPDGSCSSMGTSWSKTMLDTAFGTDWQHYRWKVYYFVVNLKNLQQLN